MVKGTAYWYKEDYESTLDSFNKALDYIDNDPGLYNHLASTYARIGNEMKTEQDLHKAENLAERTNNTFEKAQSYRIRAEIAEDKENYIKAMDYYIVANDEYSRIQALVESHDCVEKIDGIMELIRRETGEVVRKNLILKQEESFGDNIIFL